tara:strand:+ start:2076 stop:2291 length:216 start_codon:yes stop_codon:yes gene_type:complete
MGDPRLEPSLIDARGWALQRIQKLTDTKTIESVYDSYAIFEEFKEWIDPEEEDTEIYSMEFLGEGSEYDSF